MKTEYSLVHVMHIPIYIRIFSIVSTEKNMTYGDIVEKTMQPK